MKRQMQGIGLILFGILLVLISALNENWVFWSLGPQVSYILTWLGLITGVIGVLFLFQNDQSDK